ncbi:MAG TPA: hypothetical protein VKA94_02520, partial [Hyphomicrobiales bacterium]|nr:hypothetical protein [Hyphomicrobiales bacterium]
MLQCNSAVVSIRQTGFFKQDCVVHLEDERQFLRPTWFLNFFGLKRRFSATGQGRMFRTGRYSYVASSVTEKIKLE